MTSRRSEERPWHRRRTRLLLSRASRASRALVVSATMYLSVGCYTRTPVTPMAGNAFVGSDLVRVTMRDGRHHNVWYPTMSGDTAIVGLTNGVVHESTPTVRLAIRDVERVERVKLDQRRSMALLLGIGGAVSYAVLYVIAAFAAD